MAKEGEEGLDNEALQNMHTKVTYSRTYGSGGSIEQYGKEEVALTIEGPLKDVKVGKDIPKMVYAVLANMKILVNDIHDRNVAALKEKAAGDPVAIPEAAAPAKPAPKKEAKQPEKPPAPAAAPGGKPPQESHDDDFPDDDFKDDGKKGGDVL